MCMYLAAVRICSCRPDGLIEASAPISQNIEVQESKAALPARCIEYWQTDDAIRLLALYGLAVRD